MTNIHTLRKLASRVFGLTYAVLSLIRAFLSGLKTKKTDRVVIYDDTFPSLLSPFRISEINSYLDHFHNVTVYSSRPSYREDFREYLTWYPQFGGKIFRFNRRLNYSGKLAYCLFLHNTFDFLPFIEKYRIPFVFELYPGGFFRLNDTDSDNKLKAVMGSAYFRKVIVTQTITRDYLLGKEMCSADKIEFIYGGVFPTDFYRKKMERKIHYPSNKMSFDICFVAHKNMPQGQDKGYNTFIQVARILSAKYSNIYFHVVGNFDEIDVDVETIKDTIRFYGTQRTDFFPEFYSKMDIILSPNRANTLDNGAFDGFPTGCCVEAAFCGVAVFCTDPLNLNVAFTNREDIVLISTNPVEIAEEMVSFLDAYERLYELSEKGRSAFMELFAVKAQMMPRLKLLDNISNAIS